MPYRKLCTKLLLETQSAPNGHDYRITKYGANNSPISALVDVPNSEQFDFGKPAASSSGILLNPLHQKIISIKAQGNSTQAASSVPKYTCQGKSKVYNQRIINGNFESTSNWRIYNYPSNLTVNDNIATLTASGYIYCDIGQGDLGLPASHTFLLMFWLKGVTDYNTLQIRIPSSTQIATKTVTSDWQFISHIFTTSSVTNSMELLGVGTSTNSRIQLKDIMLVDLTAIYGAGNEPATVSAFLADYPFFASYVAYTTGAIHSISSITLGGQTVSVDLRSAGSVYDEWASNSRGTRKVGVRTIAAADVSLLRSYTDVLYYGITKPANMYGYGGYTNIPLLNNGGWTQLVDNWSSADHIGTYATGASQTQIWFGFSTTTTLAEAQAALDGLIIQYKLGDSYVAPFTAGSPLTLASGLTPTDQDGNAVTFTEGTEATPSPNYPVPIVNSTLISITDGQDTNSAAVDLAGLTDKDEVYVNVKSTNIWYEEWEVGGYDTTTGEKTVRNDCFRSKNYISVTPDGTYYFYYGGAGSSYLHLIEYDADKQFIRSTLSVHNSSRQMAANCHYITFYVYNAITYNHDISISLGSTATPYMPHNTRGKVWYKQQVGRVDFSDLSINYDGGNTIFYAQITGMRTDAYTSDELLSEAYKCNPNTLATLPNYSIRFAGGSDYIYIRDYDFTNGAALKAARAGQHIYYPLATPVWTDITSSAMGAALLAMETYEGDTNTATVDNNGQSNVEYWRQV